MNIRAMTLNQRKLVWLVSVLLIGVIGGTIGIWDFSQMPAIAKLIGAAIIGGLLLWSGK